MKKVRKIQTAILLYVFSGRPENCTELNILNHLNLHFLYFSQFSIHTSSLSWIPVNLTKGRQMFWEWSNPPCTFAPILVSLANNWGVSLKFFKYFFVHFFGGLECVGHFFAYYVAYFVFWEMLGSNSDGCRSKQARYQLNHRTPYLATHLPV